VRIQVRVHPRARQDHVGGRHGEGEPPTLIVRVRAAPHDGEANAACQKVLADAFGVPRQAVTIVTGAKSRSKTIEVDGADATRFQDLLGPSDGQPHQT
jgi:uncharacterized protein